MTAKEAIQQIYDKFDRDMLDKKTCMPLIEMAGKVKEFNELWHDDMQNPFDQPIGWNIGEFIADCINIVQS